MTFNFSRPNLPYAYSQLQNSNRYQVLTSLGKPPTAIQLDSDIDYLIDATRSLDLAMGSLTAGVIPGAALGTNANKVVTTDGAGNVSWVFVTNNNVTDNSLSGSKLIASSVTGNQLQDGTITASELAPNCIETTQILDGNITLAKMAPNSVSTLNVIDANITLPKMALNSVGTGNILDSNITLAKMAPSSVGTTNIVAASITLGKMAPNSVGTANILDLNVTANKIANNTITATQVDPAFLTGGAVKADQIAGTSTTVYTNPSVQQNHPSAAKFWCSFDGTVNGTNPPTSGYNVATVNRYTNGGYIINFPVPFTTTDYAVFISYYCGETLVLASIISRTTSSVTIQLWKVSDSGGANPNYVSVIGYGLQ